MNLGSLGLYPKPVGYRIRLAEKKKASGSKAVFHSDEKQEVREAITNRVSKLLGVVPRTLTLPDRDGRCAIHFRNNFTGVEEIIGICNKERTVRESTMTSKDAGSMIVDRFFKNSVKDVVMYARSLHDPAIKKPPIYAMEIVSNFSMHPVRVNRPTGEIFGRFDFAFLDYCGHPNASRFDEVSGFIEHCTTEQWAVAVTFNLGSKKDKEHYSDMSAADIIRPIVDRSGCHIDHAEKYSNKRIPMMFAILTNK